MNGYTNDIPAPRSVSDVEELVKRLYSAGSPQLITGIDERLKQLQRSSEGWQIADALLASDDPQVRFFGALTFQVKLNNDGASLDEGAAQTVLHRLIHWIIVSIQREQSGLVRKKLCSTLATYYIRSPVLWEHPLLQLAASFKHGAALTMDDVSKAGVTMQQLFPLPTLRHYESILQFCATLAHEVGKIENSSPAHAKHHAQMEAIVADARVVITWGLDGQDDTAATSSSEALRCLQTWISYAQPMWPTKPEALEHVRSISPSVFRYLISENDLESEALDVVRDILDTYTSFFRPEDMQLLGQVIVSRLGPRMLELFQEEQFDEAADFGEVIVAYSKAVVQDIMYSPTSDHSQYLFTLLGDKILREPKSWPGWNDSLSASTVDFWNTYVELVIDTQFSLDLNAPRPSWLAPAKDVLPGVVDALCFKMQIPPTEITDCWEDQEKSLYREFRTDATDCVGSMFVLKGSEIQIQLVQLLLSSLKAKAWRPLEAAMYCLSMLVDNILEGNGDQTPLASVFGSSLFREVADFTQQIPPQTRRTAVDMLGYYGDYIEQHAEYLPDALRFLFASLEAPALANSSAKSIALLCSACRQSLTSELDGFLSQYQRFLQSSTCDSYTKEKVVGGIASIIQALQPESLKIRPLMALLDNVSQDAERTRQYMEAGDPESAESTGVSALTCLASIGRASQVPEDVPILLDDDENDAQAAKEKAEVWSSAEGTGLQHRITGCFSILNILNNSGEAIDAACSVLRSGFAESTPGPFVLPPSVTVNFLQQCSLSTSQLESVLSTAGMLITQHSRQNTSRIEPEVTQILASVSELLSRLVDPANDPSIAQALFDVCSRLLPTYATLLLNSPQESQTLILSYTIQAVRGQDPLPKRSACDFWAKLITLAGPQTTHSDNTVKGQTQELLSHYGPQLSVALMAQIGGLGQRSELDYLCEPLKALVYNVPVAKRWLERALLGEGFPQPVEGQGVGEAEKRRFLQQVIALRGAKKTRDVVREFFVNCRGTVGSY